MRVVATIMFIPPALIISWWVANRIERAVRGRR